MVTYEKVIVEFLYQRFGPTVGNMILKNNMSKYRIPSFSSLDLNSQLQFTDKLLKEVFGKFMDDNELKELKKILAIRYCVMQSLDKISSNFSVHLFVKPFDIKKKIKTEIKNQLEKIDNNKAGFVITTSGLLNSITYVFIDKKDLILIGQYFTTLQRNPGSEDDKVNITNTIIQYFMQFYNESATIFFNDKITYKTIPQETLQAIETIKSTLDNMNNNIIHTKPEITLNNKQLEVELFITPILNES